MELDYKKMFEESQKNLTEMFALQQEFCDLAAYIKDNTDKCTIVAERIFELSIADQVVMLRQTAAITRLSVALYDKYQMGESAETEDNQNEQDLS